MTYHRRISGLTPQTCNLLMVESPCHRVNQMDIAIVCSHINALYHILHDTHPQARQSPYFLVLEDDVRFLWEVDLLELIRVAPKGFGALQLMMSHKLQIEHAWDLYNGRRTDSVPDYLGRLPSDVIIEHNNPLFWYRPRNSTVWSAQAILYHRPAIERLVNRAVDRDRKGRLGFKLINSFDYVKYSPYKINPYKPSVACECLFADNFLYAVAQPAYILTVPLLNSGREGMNSSIHQDHVQYHVHGFSKIEEIYLEMISRREKATTSREESIGSPRPPELPGFIKRPIYNASSKNSMEEWRSLAGQDNRDIVTLLTSISTV